MNAFIKYLSDVRKFTHHKKIQNFLRCRYVELFLYFSFLIVTCLAIYKIYENNYQNIQKINPEWTREAVQLKYLGGDLQYLPFAYSLSKLNFGEFQVVESNGAALVPFPFASSLPVAIIIGVFGEHGWFFVKPFIVICYLFAANFIFLAITNKRRLLSLVLAIAYVFGFLDPIIFTQKIGLPETITQAISTRIPRPFLTGLYELLFFGILLRIIKLQKASNFYFGLLAATLAILIQGQIYTGYIFCIVLFLLMLNNCIRIDGKNTITFASVFLVVMSPMLYQRIVSSYELTFRFGLEIVERNFFINRIISNGEIRYLLYILCAVIVSWAVKFFMKSELYKYFYNQIAILFLLLVIPVLALDLFGLTTGTMVQGYHFNEALESMKPLIAFVFISIVFSLSSLATSHINIAFFKFLKSPANIILVSIIAFIGMTFHVYKARDKYFQKQDINGWHIRADFDEYRELGDSYQSAFSELIRFMKSRVAPLEGVLMTFDHQVQGWWMFSGDNRYLYFPDVFMSTLDRSEIENRFAAGCKFLGLDSGQCIELINSENSNYELLGSNNSINNIYFSHAFYHANSAFSNPNIQYSSVERLSFDKIPIEHSWFLLIPNSEIIRLKNKFEISQSVYIEPDLIILFSKGRLSYLNHTFLAGAKGKDYQLIYHNDIFNVYERLNKSKYFIRNGNAFISN